MINGLDAQHLKTVHNISIDMELQTEEASDGRIIDFQMTGPLPSENAAHRMMSRKSWAATTPTVCVMLTPQLAFYEQWKRSSGSKSRCRADPNDFRLYAAEQRSDPRPADFHRAKAEVSLRAVEGLQFTLGDGIWILVAAR